METEKKVKRRVPKKGVIRYFNESMGMELVTHRCIVTRTSKTNAPVRRGYTGIIGPPALEHTPHVLLFISADRTRWVSVTDLHLSRRDADKAVMNAYRIMAHARRISPVDGPW